MRRVKPGFTLIELLIVMVIIGILATIGLVNFGSARLKARDAKRKSDLATIAKSLEAYANDHSSYPAGSAGTIICAPPTGTCAFGSPFADTNNTLYAAKLPEDSSAPNRLYYYTSTGTSYTLYAALENTNDPSFDGSIVQACGSGITCNYKVSSSNLP